jgi:dihydrofolate reductase
MISIVVAHSTNLVIGRDGDLPWRLPSDLKHFREITDGGAVVMGRATYESLPDSFRPLPNRRNIVLTSDPDYRADGAEVMASLEEALDACGRDCFVIGGGVTYEQALAHSDQVYATVVAEEVEGDTHFPPLPETEWQLIDCSEPLSENGFSFSFRRYEREREPA